MKRVDARGKYREAKIELVKAALNLGICLLEYGLGIPRRSLGRLNNE